MSEGVMCVCVCVCVWMCGCVWVCGCVGVWVCRCVGVAELSRDSLRPIRTIGRGFVARNSNIKV